MPEFDYKTQQIVFFGQLCFSGKKFRVQALERANEVGSGELS